MLKNWLFIFASAPGWLSPHKLANFVVPPYPLPPYLPLTNTPPLPGHFLPFTFAKISESQGIDSFHLQGSKEVETPGDPHGLPDTTPLRSGLRGLPFVSGLALRCHES